MSSTQRKGKIFCALTKRALDTRTTYVVDGVSYTIRENITVKNEAIKMEGIPVGQKKTEYITAGIDESVAVKYDPENPKKAYLKDNAGKSV